MKCSAKAIHPIFLSAVAWLVLLLVGNAAAFADDGPRLGGFGTIGYVADNRSDIALARDISQKPKGRVCHGRELDGGFPRRRAD